MSPNPRVNSQDSLFLRAGDRVEGSSWSSFPADVSTTCSWFSLASAAACSVFLRILLSSHSLMLESHRAPVLRPLCPHSVSGNLNQPHGFKKYLETARHLVYLSRPSLFPEGQANASSRLPDFSAVASKQSLLLPRLFTAYGALLSTSLDSFPFPFTPCNESIGTAARFSWRIHPDTDYLSPFHCYQPARRWLGSEHSPTRGSPCFLSWTPLQHILGPASREIYRPREITSSPFSLLSSGFSPLSLVPSPYHSPRAC